MKASLRLFLLIVFFGFTSSFAQEAPENKWGNLTGNAGIDAQYYNRDDKINAPLVPDKFRMNSFLFLTYQKGGFSAAARYEAYLPKPLLGIDQNWTGQGIMFRYAAYRYKGLEVTAGSFYEQFGNGLILRSYEARALGFDNFIDGVRVKFGAGGFYVKGIFGKKRNFFGLSPGVVRGADLEINFSEVFPRLQKTKFNLIIGGSFLSKYQEGSEKIIGNEILQIPENVGSGAGRIQMSIGKFSMNTELAYKANDPSAMNKYIYKPGTAFLTTFNFSTTNFGASLGLKRIDNFDFRTDREENGNKQLVNFIPMLNRQHTYTLAATIYPYAVQNMGENGIQSEINFTVPRGSKLGGKYGIDVSINFSAVWGLDTSGTVDRYGYKSKILGVGNMFYRDFNVELSKKFSKKFKLNLMYMNLYEDLNVIPVSTLGKDPFVNANIGVIDFSWRINTDHALRFEFQTLYTKQDQGSWFMNLIEYTVAPNWFVSVMNQFNFGHPVVEKRLHYPMVAAGYNMGNHRFQISYGRQRAGVLCIGGVCRAVPAANGLMFSYVGSF